jgi:transcriptional regulatory protein LevR
MATSARKLVGLSGDCLKTEVQMYVMKRFNLIPAIRLKIYDKSVNIVQTGAEQLLNPLKEQYKKEKHPVAKKELKEKIDLVKKEYKKAMLKISKEIEKEFNLSEHKADALILALAIKRYKEAQKEL